MQRYAVESISEDVAQLRALILTLHQHRDSGLLIFGAMPFISLFVVESHDLLAEHHPEIRSLLDESLIALIHSSRHRIKLLDAKKRTIDEVADELQKIQVAHREFFITSHGHGPWSMLKRWLQPDMGLFRYREHLFSTTHLCTYNVGMLTVEEMQQAGSETWVDLGKYIGVVANLLSLSHYASDVPGLSLTGEVSATDIKSEGLYNGGPLVELVPKYAVSLILVLAQVNYVHHVLREITLPGTLAFFKLKLICAYHAISSIRSLQAAEHQRGATKSLEIISILGRALGAPGSKWIRKNRQLRNYLVHYRLDSQKGMEVHSNTSHLDVVNMMIVGHSLSEAERILDECLGVLSEVLEKGLGFSRTVSGFGETKIDPTP